VSSRVASFGGRLGPACLARHTRVRWVTMKVPSVCILDMGPEGCERHSARCLDLGQLCVYLGDLVGQISRLGDRVGGLR
jgi:hypothetical protein